MPPSGNGLTKETAQHTAAFSKNTSETSYVVHRMLESIKWLRCTKDEAKHWKDIGYDIFDAAGRKTSLDTLFFGDQPEVDPAAFATHFDEVASAEHALEAAGISATRGEGLMTGKWSSDRRWKTWLLIKARCR